MKRLLLVSVVLGLCTTGSMTEAEAGCVTGAVVGGIAGHLLGHHGMLGAAAGCAIGASRRHSYRRDYYHRDAGYGYGYHRPYGY